MAFGAPRLSAFFFGGANSITNPISAAGNSVPVSVGDLIVAVISQQTANTSTACGDNLGNTYTAQNAGSLATISGRMWYSRATVAGTLTSVDFTTTASANDCAVVAVVYEGPFSASPIDVNPSNLTGDITTPYSCPASGTLAQAQELIIGWFAAASIATFTAGGGFTKNAQQSQSANASAHICSLVVSATTTQTPSWTGTAPTASVLGTASFKRDPINATTASAAGSGAALAEGAIAPPPRVLVSFVEIEGVEAAAVASGAGAGTAAGQGAAVATGASFVARSVAATGTATATGQAVSFVAATATATATSTAQATGRVIVAGVGNATGAGAATAISRATVAGVASAAGLGSAQAGGQWIVAAVAMAAGLGQAQAVGLVSTGNIKTQYLTGRRSKHPMVTGTKPPPLAIIAQRNAAATWIGQQ